MKKLSKIIILLLITLLISETYFYLIQRNTWKKVFEIKNKIHNSNVYELKYFSRPRYFTEISTVGYGNKLINCNKYKERSTVIFGCSYADSYEIKIKKEKFCNKLSDELKRPVFFPLWFFQTIKYFQNLLENLYISNKGQEELFANFIIFMKEVKNETSKKFPNSKFVILLYDDSLYWKDIDFINHANWDLLRKEGFYIFDTKELTNKDLSKKEYKAEDFYHPNAKAWEEIVPPLVQKLKKL